MNKEFTSTLTGKVLGVNAKRATSASNIDIYLRTESGTACLLPVLMVSTLLISDLFLSSPVHFCISLTAMNILTSNDVHAYCCVACHR